MDVNINRRWLVKAVIVAATLCVSALFLFMASPVAAGGLGFTGNFYRFGFVMERGQTSVDIEAYVVVINRDVQSMQVKMKTETPPGVTISMPETDFVLVVDGQKRLNVLVEVSPDAELGEYKLTISAESYLEGGGIKISGGGMQDATLKIVQSPPKVLPIIGGIAGALLLAFIGLALLRKRLKSKRLVNLASLVVCMGIITTFIPVKTFAQTFWWADTNINPEGLPVTGTGEVVAAEDISQSNIQKVVAGFEVVVPTEPISVGIEVRESINPKSKGKITVTILSTPSFNAVTDVNTSSLTFGRAGTETSFASVNKKRQDANGDGLIDLVVQFYISLTGIQAGDTLVILKGMTTSGIPIEGNASIQTKGK